MKAKTRFPGNLRLDLRVIHPAVKLQTKISLTGPSNVWAPLKNKSSPR